jgi:hypothetical protein
MPGKFLVNDGGYIGGPLITELLNLLDTYEENAERSYIGCPSGKGIRETYQHCADQLKRVLELYGIKE